MARAIWKRIEALAADPGEEILEVFRPDNADTLRACGVSRAKLEGADRHPRSCHGRLAGRGGLARHGPRRAERQLRAIWGIGQWTCDMAAIFHFGDHDIWPEGDAAVARTFARYIGRRQPARTAARFAPQRSILALFLWAIMDRVP